MALTCHPLYGQLLPNHCQTVDTDHTGVEVALEVALGANLITIHPGMVVLGASMPTADNNSNLNLGLPHRAKETGSLQF